MSVFFWFGYLFPCSSQASINTVFIVDGVIGDWVKGGNIRESQKCPLSTYLISSVVFSQVLLVIVGSLFLLFTFIWINVFHTGLFLLCINDTVLVVYGWLGETLIWVEIFGNPKKFHSLLTCCPILLQFCFFNSLLFSLSFLSPVFPFNFFTCVRRQYAQCVSCWYEWKYLVILKSSTVYIPVVQSCFDVVSLTFYLYLCHFC